MRETSPFFVAALVVTMTLTIPLVGSPATAFAAEVEEVSICEGRSNVRIEGHPSASWSDVIGRVCADLDSMKDRDASAMVRLIASENDLIVEVVLNDGRSAIRRVKRPLALHSALEALLTLPPDARPAADRTTTASIPAIEPASLSTLANPRQNDAPSSGAPATPSSSSSSVVPTNAGRTMADVSLSAVGRVAGSGFLSVGGAAEAHLASGHWLFGLSARWDAFQWVSAPKRLDYEIDTIGAGVAVARRIAFRSPDLDLDLGFSPRLLVETQSAELPTRDPTEEDGTDDQTRTTTDVRLAPFARLHFGRGPLRIFAGLDGEISPARLRRKVRFDSSLPALPAWSAGLSAGVSWAAP